MSTNVLPTLMVVTKIQFAQTLLVLTLANVKMVGQVMASHAQVSLSSI